VRFTNNGLPPFLATTAGQYIYNCPANCRRTERVFAEVVSTFDRNANVRFYPILFQQRAFYDVKVRQTDALEDTPATVTFGFDPGTTTTQFYHLYWVQIEELASEDIELSLPNWTHLHLIMGVLAYIQAEKYGDISRFEDWLHRNGNKIRYEMNRGDQGEYDETITQPEYRVTRYQRSAVRRY
jgi:hypothetical protein